MFIEMCPPLLSDTLDITCNLYDEYVNCSNASMPDTIAITSCKPTYTAPDEQRRLYCQSNGMWNKQLISCNPCNYFFLV